MSLLDGRKNEQNVMSVFERFWLRNGFGCATSDSEANVGLTRIAGSAPDVPPKFSRKEKRRICVMITNPLPGGADAMSLWNAEREVKRGRAHLGDGEVLGRIYTGRLTLVDHSHDRLIAAEQALILGAYGYDKSVSMVLARKIEMAGVPIVASDSLLGRGKRSAGPLLYRAGTIPSFR